MPPFGGGEPESEKLPSLEKEGWPEAGVVRSSHRILSRSPKREPPGLPKRHPPLLCKEGSFRLIIGFSEIIVERVLSDVHIREH